MCFFFKKEKPLFIHRQGTCSEPTQIKCNLSIITAMCLNRSINYRRTLKKKNSQHKTVVLWILLKGNCSQTVHKMRKPRNWQQWTTSRLHLFYFHTTSVFTFTEYKITLSREHTVRLWILLWKMCQHVLCQTMI